MKSPIVLLTDYGYQDPYAGILRAVIACRAPHHPILDLTHGISAQNIQHAAIYLEDSYRYYPKGSIFVCVVDPGVGTSRQILCVKSKNYYFMAPDNGLLTGVFEAEPFIQIRRVDNVSFFLSPTPSGTFHGRDIFAPAASALAKNPRIVFSEMGPRIRNFKRLEPSAILKNKSSVLGNVIYFDHFGNAITTIKRSMATNNFWKRSQVFAAGRRLGEIRDTYGKIQKLLPLWNSSQRLEIAIPCGKASQHLKMNSKIQVIFEKEKI